MVASALEFNSVFSNDPGARLQDRTLFRMWSSWKFEPLFSWRNLDFGVTVARSFLFSK